MSDRAVSWAPGPDVLGAIPVGALHDFLTRRGWVLMPSSASRPRYYEHATMRLDDGRPMYYYAPASEHARDYPLGVLDFIENQARFWDLDPWAVFRELTGAGLAEPVRTSVPA